MNKCTICKKPIVLVPSAAERSRTTGHPASYFTNLFREHSDCQLAKRAADTSELMRRTRSSK